MLSDRRIQKLAQLFTCVAVDPRDRNVDRGTFRHKSTRYVPEVVFLDVRNGEEAVVTHVEDHSVEGVIQAMNKALNAYSR
ncbi:MAG: hypothetical protein AAF488_13680 [Planctomycetota bacterium]